MAKYQISDSILINIADKIRSKLGTTVKYTLDDINNSIDTVYDKGVSDGSGSATPLLQEKTVDPSESTAIVTPDSDMDGLSKVTVNPISSGYVGSGITRQGAKTVTPSESQQVAVQSGVYTTGNIIVSAAEQHKVNVTVGSNVSAAGAYTIASGIDFVKNHYSDPKFFCGLIRNDGGGSAYGVTAGICSNTPIISSDRYFLFAGLNTSGKFKAFSYAGMAYKPTATGSSGSYVFMKANANGDLILNLISTCGLASGNYTVFYGIAS